MPATLTRPPLSVVRRFRRAGGGDGEAVLSVTTTPVGDYRLVLTRPGEEDWPTVYLYTSVAAARLCWGLLQDSLTAAGYRRVK